MRVPRLSWRSSYTSENVPAAHPRVIALDLSDMYDYASRDNPFHGRWSSFDILLSQLTHLKKIVIGFSHKNHMSTFMLNVLGVQMSHTSTNLECQALLVRRRDRYSPYTCFFAPAEAEVSGVSVLFSFRNPTDTLTDNNARPICEFL